MIRKMLLIAAAIAIPLGGTAVVTGVAAASAPPPFTPITCHVGTSTTTFAGNGLSENGTFTTASTSVTTTTAATMTCGAAGPGSLPAQIITTANTACTGAGAPSPVCTGPTGFVESQVSGFSSSSTTLWMDIPKIKFKIGSPSVTYKSKSSSSSATICGGTEPGFNIKGKLTAPASAVNQPTKLTACLSGDTGPNTTGNFAADLSAANSDPTIFIQTAGLDPTLTKLKIT
jgi:hypothetical protein